MGIKRYEFTVDGWCRCDNHLVCDEREDGDYVTYADYASNMATMEYLLKEVLHQYTIAVRNLHGMDPDALTKAEELPIIRNARFILKSLENEHATK